MPARIAPLDHFQTLVTSIAVMARSAKALSKTALPEITPAQRAAWSAITRPERVVNIPLQAQRSGGADLTHFSPAYADNPAYAGQARFFPLLSDNDCSLLTAGLHDCAAHARAIAHSDAFAKAAALQAPLIVAAGGTPEAPELAYPLMGLSLKAGRTTIDNKRADTLVGHALFRAGDIHFSVNGRFSQAGTPASPATWLAGPADPNPLDPEALSALVAARAQTPGYSYDPDARYLRFGAALRSEAPVELSADLPLPSVALLRERAPQPLALSGMGSIGVEKESGPRAELAPAKAATAAGALQSVAALNALSLCLGAAEERPLALKLASERRLATFPLGSAQAHTKANLFEGNRYNSSAQYVGRDHAQLYYGLASGGPAARNAISDEQIDALVAPILRASALNPELAGGYGQPISFGELGHGLKGLSNALSKADPRLSLFQWSLSLSTFDDASAKTALAYLSPERGALLSAMVELRSAVAEAQSAFLDKALSAAEATESAWLAERGLLPSWRQAQSAGAVSARSIAWARLNPASELLASDNPMEALGARCAKAWGLRVGDQADKSFLTAFQEALAERGGQSAAWSAFSENADLRERLAQLTAATATVDKAVAHSARGALAFYIRAVERSATLAMPPDEISRFTRAYIEPEIPESPNQFYYRQQALKLTFAQRLGSLKFFATAGSLSAGSWDGLSPGLGLSRLSNGPTAELARELNLGKHAQYDAMIDALAQDWAETVGSCVESGQTPIAAEPIARARASELAHAFPTDGANAFDWRQPVFSDAPAWRVLGAPSPRYSAAANAALSQGALGVWSAGLARSLDIRDAQDGNDLIGQTRDAVKRLTGLTDAAWRQVIKQPEALEYLRAQMNAKASPVPLERRLPEADQGAILASRGVAGFESAAGQEARQLAEADLRARDAGRLFSMASTMNLPLEKALQVGRTLPADLFSATIGSLELGGSDGAGFYLTELNAKRDRAPYILKEAVKRFDKLALDAQAPAIEGQTRQTAEQAFSAETTDLADWIKNSEPGLWQELPAQPTWGQLRRASAEWHDEQAAIARDKNERRMAKEAREAAGEIMLHVDAAGGDPTQAVKVGSRNLMGEFANPAGSGWPRVVGRYARDGWEAIELLTASQLTEEGAAMSHCVSSYSGKCRSGEARIFSVRLNGERVCTLQISGKAPLAKLDETAVFTVPQNRGKHNAAVTSNAALAFCAETHEAFSASWTAMCVKRRELIAAEIARKKAEESGEAPIPVKARARKAKAG